MHEIHQPNLIYIQVVLEILDFLLSRFSHLNFTL